MATFKSKMSKLDPLWADKIWKAIKTGNKTVLAKSSNDYTKWVDAGKPGRPLSIMLPVAALALTGVRPISLERGITFSIIEVDGISFIQAHSNGAKIVRNEKSEIIRGQEDVKISWRLTPPAQASHRRDEMREILKAVLAAPNRSITISYNAESISTLLRELSKKIWPRRKHHVSGICYRELFSMAAKDAGTEPIELAAAMGHLSARSQEKYHRRQRGKGGIAPAKPFSSATATTTPKAVVSPTDRLAAFKRKSAIKKLMHP